jgi:hypothetical protein
MEERRNYSRVRTRITGLARLASGLEEEARHSVGAPMPGPSASLEGAKLPAPVVEFLLGLDRKLDQLLSHQTLERLEREYPLHLDVREISGDGMRFLPPEPLAPGSALEVVLLLRQAPLRMAVSKGRVLECYDDATCSLEFVNIRENDFEAVMAFVFEEQRQKIRSHKMSG